jgi:hypothetical protein
LSSVFDQTVNAGVGFIPTFEPQKQSCADAAPFGRGAHTNEAADFVRWYRPDMAEADRVPV